MVESFDAVPDEEGIETTPPVARTTKTASGLMPSLMTKGLRLSSPGWWCGWGPRLMPSLMKKGMRRLSRRVEQIPLASRLMKSLITEGLRRHWRRVSRTLAARLMQSLMKKGLRMSRDMWLGVAGQGLKSSLIKKGLKCQRYAGRWCEGRIHIEIGRRQSSSSCSRQ